MATVERKLSLRELGLLTGRRQAAVGSDVDGSAVFQRVVQWAWPFPIGSSDTIAMNSHFRAACSFGIGAASYGFRRCSPLFEKGPMALLVSSRQQL